MGYGLLANEKRYTSISDLGLQISDLRYLVTEDHKLVADPSRFSMQREDVNSVSFLDPCVGSIFLKPTSLPTTFKRPRTRKKNCLFVCLFYITVQMNRIELY